MMQLSSATRSTTSTAPNTQARAVQTRASLFANIFKPAAGKGGNKVAQREQAKDELLERIKGLDRGASATAQDKEDVERLASALEKLNPTPKPLATPQLLSGKWRLLYTTSSSILATNRPPFLRPSGPIYQTLDAEKLKARNNESAPFYNQVTAELTPLSASRVAVQFKQFKLLNLITINAPPTARGELDVTYLDESLRVSRGNNGNLFVLDMADRDVRL